MNNGTLKNAFPIVATAIGRRYGVRVQVGGHEAYTDGKTIQLPAYDGTDPDYRDFAWGLLAHEAAHLRYSDFTLKAQGGPLKQRIAGAIEDVRIEYLLMMDFPGTRMTLSCVIDRMISQGGFRSHTLSDHPGAVLYGYILKSQRCRVLKQQQLASLVDETRRILQVHYPTSALDRLDRLLDTIPTALSEEKDSHRMADKIMDLFIPYTHRGSPKTAGSHQESGHDASEWEKTDESLQELYPELSEQELEPDVFETIKQALDIPGRGSTECVIPVCLDPRPNLSRGQSIYCKVQTESVGLWAGLEGLIRSQRMKTCPNPRRGRLNGRKLYRLKLADPSVFIGRRMTEAANTAIHILLDKSESMAFDLFNDQDRSGFSRLPVAIEATMALAMGLESIPGVNPAVTAFPGENEGSVYRVLGHEQSVKHRLASFALEASGSTPLTEALWYGASELLAQKESRKILMVITDGQPDDRMASLEMLKRLERSGIETFGIGLGLSVDHLFQQSIRIDETRDLGKKLFDLSGRLLTTD